MPKILLYITAKVIWNFLFWNTDYHENRAHVHVGKRSTENLCKIWLEPIVEIEKQGDLTDAQAIKNVELFNSGDFNKMLDIEVILKIDD